MRSYFVLISSVIFINNCATTVSNYDLIQSTYSNSEIKNKKVFFATFNKRSFQPVLQGADFNMSYKPEIEYQYITDKIYPSIYNKLKTKLRKNVLVEININELLKDDIWS